MVYAFVKIHKIYMFTLNATTIAESRLFATGAKQEYKQKIKSLPIKYLIGRLFFF